MPKFLFVIFVLFARFVFAQSPYPQDYFNNPLDIPLVLSGTFGELRSNHFHSGMDIKTQQRRGLNVISAAKGYVSRIKVSHWGYGKALYITHPNGYVSVYAHLQKFAPKIEAYIKAQQYKKESYEIELFPDATILPIQTNEIVAYTGNSGSSGGPHLHFELRDKNERPINPMLFGIDVKDHIKPKVLNVVAYPLNEMSHINSKNKYKPLELIKLDNGNYRVKTFNAYGKIGIGIETHDKLDGAYNKNGVSNISSFYNGNKNFEIDFKRFSFNETKHINRLIDYSYYKTNKSRIQKLFLEKNNPLSLYKNVIDDGYLTVEDSTTNQFKIKVKDFKGNETNVIIEINGKKIDSVLPNPKKVTDRYIYADRATTLKEGNISVYAASHTFYDDFYIDFDTDLDTLYIHNEEMPTQKQFYINYNISKYNKPDKDKLFIARVGNYKDQFIYIPTKRKGDSLTARTNVLGKYTITSDIESPKIKPINVQSGKWISKESHLKIKITDDLSGISNYRATINGKWILMEYDPKKDLLVHDFSDAIINEAEHNLKLIITDNVGNSSTFETTFFRK